MARYEVSDELWERIQPLLPIRPRRSRWLAGYRWTTAPASTASCSLLTGISWADLPQQLGHGSGMTCWRRLRDWTTAGVWDQLHALLLAELHAAGQIDWSRAAVDGSHVRAKRRPRRRAR